MYLPNPTEHREFTGFEYTLIDIASHFGLDKLTFPERLIWAAVNIENLEYLAEKRGHWKEHPLYMKGVLALRRMQAGQPTGHIVGLDAVCSGMQMLSCMAGCEIGARSTGMIDPEVRSDAYTACTAVMKTKIPTLEDSSRADIKQACMTTLYGSVKIPEALFGEDTRELNAFYESLFAIAPGAFRLIDVLRNSWQAYALVHSWALPDAHQAEVPVMETIDKKIEVDELVHITFNYRYKVNCGAEKGLSLIANVTHSVDAWVLRSIVRRCNYDLTLAAHADGIIQSELLQREMFEASENSRVIQNDPESVADALMARYKASGIADISMIQYITEDNAKRMDTEHLRKLQYTLYLMAQHDPFEVICVHDEFKCSPNHMNELRMHYREIMAELAESRILDDILTQITGKTTILQKPQGNLGNLIRQSNYAIC